MSNNLIYRNLLRLPNVTFGTDFTSNVIDLKDINTLDVLVITGGKIADEIGKAVVTLDGIKEDGTVITGIKFLKRQFGKYIFDSVIIDEIGLETCPLNLEYRITEKMLAKLSVSKVKINITAVPGSKTNYCILTEGTDIRYSSEVLAEMYVNDDLTPPQLLSLIATVDGADVHIVDGALSVEKNSLTSVIRATMSKPVRIIATPKVVVEIGGTIHDYANLTVDETDDAVVVITPIGSYGIASLVGEFILYLNDSGSIQDSAGNSAGNFIINLTVTDTTG